MRTTTSTSEDSGAATGWTIEGFRYFPFGTGWQASVNLLKISVNQVLDLPAAPANLDAAVGDGQVVLSWDDPQDAYITKYQYSTDGGTGYTDIALTDIDSSETGKFKYTVGNLTNGTTHTFDVRAVNSAGNGGVSTDTAVMMPAAPTEFKATPRDQRVDLSWDDPGNDSITKYQYSTDGGTNFADIPDSDASTITYNVTVLSDGTDTALANGTTYTLAVRAVNSSGVGGAATDTATPTPAPLAPRNLRATPGDGQVALSWDDPGNATITKYQYSTDGGANFSDFDGGSNSATTAYTVTGLTNSTEYTLALRAVNPTGNGEASTVTALILPAKPTGLTGIEYNSQVELGWDDPDDSTITKYQLLQITPRKLTSSDGTVDDYFGMAVAADADTALVGALQAYDADLNNRPGAAYVFTWNSVSGVWTKNATLNPSDGDDGDGFGRSVALDGDTAVVGAYENDEGEPGEGQVTNTGSAYIFTKDSQGMWKQTAQLTASDAADGDQFGYSVAVDGDTIVVGAHMDDDGGAESGSVYVFTKPSGDDGWDDWNSLSADGKANLTAKVTAPGAAAGDKFGNSVAIDGNAIVVGAHKAGSVYAITKPSTDANNDGSNDWEDWDSLDADGKATLTAKLTASDAAAGDEFGTSVAINGNTVVVGAHQHDQSDTVNNSGAAYVFTKPGNAWATGTETAMLTASDGARGDEFGISVAVYGNTVVIGAHLDDDNGDKSGSAYLFTKPINSGWVTTTETAKIIDHDGAAEDRFGWSVAVDGSTAVVGAYGDESNKGAAHIMGIPSWTDISDSAASGANATSYAVTGLTNDVMYTFQLRAVNTSGHGLASNRLDATPKAVPHAPANLSATVGNGQVALSWNNPNDTTITGYKYSTGGASFDDVVGSNTTTTTYTVTGLTNGRTYALALRAVNSLGNGAASTVEAVMVPASPANLSAAPGDAQVALSWDDPGSATITKYQVWRHAEIAKLVEGDGAAKNDVFGNAVAVDGDTAVIGVPGDMNNGVQTGAAFVFTKGTDGWSRRAKLIAKDPEGGDQLGFSVALDGDTIVVGVLSDGLTAVESGGNADIATAGSAYVFSNPTGGWANWDGLTDTAKDGLTTKLIADDAQAGDEFGRSVAVDESTGTVVVGAWRDDSNKGSAYVFTKDSTGWSQAAKLTASNPLANDYFGQSVAVDGSTVLIGVKGDNGKGAAYVFDKPGNGWTNTTTTANTVTKLAASDGGTNDLFGASVAMDGNTALIGAEGQEWVYVFIKESEGWVEKAKLSSDDPDHDGRGNNFGNSVAVDGDIVVVGADGVDQSAAVNNTGAAYVFTKPSTGWADRSEAARFTGSDAAANDKFGGAVAVDGDTAMVGADNAAGTDALDNSVSNAGAAYVFDIGDWTDFGGKTTTSHTVIDLTNYQEYWFRIRAANASGEGPASNSASATPKAPKPVKPTGLGAVAGDTRVTLSWDNPGNSTITGYELAKVVPEDWLTAADGAASAHFGISVAIDGDTAVVGADRANNKKGSVHIFTRNASGKWTQQVKLEGENSGDQFGWSVAVDGDTVVVGAHAYNGSATLTNSGAAYVFTKPTGGWAAWAALSQTAKDGLTAKLTPTVPEAYSLFGGSVDLDDSTLVIGSRLADVGGRLSAGAAYVFTKANGVWSQSAKLTASDGLSLAYLGYSVAVDGDTVLAGAFGSSTAFGRTGNGSAYIFVKPDSDDGWADVNYNGNETTKLTASDLQPSDYFGFSVALDGDTAVVGARQHNDPGTGAGSGAAYVFTRESEVWDEKAKLTASDAAAGDKFGVSVAVEDDTVAVGSWQDDDNGRNSGSAYVFTKPALGWASTLETLKLTAPEGAANDRFGWSVAVDLDDQRGDLALVGAYSDDIATGMDAGSVHVLGIPDWMDITGSGSGTTSHTVAKELDDPDTDLSNGDEYTFQVRALNRRGAGPASAGASATPLGKPVAPRGLSVAAGDTQVTLSWTAATANATRAPITRYEYNTDGGTTFMSIPDSGPSTDNYTVLGLTNLTTYTFAVRAVNVIDEGPVSTVDATPASATPAAPILTATAGDTQVLLKWVDPHDSSIDKYEYQWTGNDGSSSWGENGSSDDWIVVSRRVGRSIAHQYTATGLTNGVEYTFEIRARDDQDTGPGDPSDGLEATPMGTPPAAPTNLEAKAGDKAVQLIWDDPNDSSIDRYQYSTSGGTTYTDIDPADVITDIEAGTKGLTVDELDNGGKLENGTTYTFQIRAVDTVDPENALDDEFGPASNEASAKPLPMPPLRPDLKDPTEGNGWVRLDWGDPQDATILRYEVLHLLKTSKLDGVGGDKFGYAVAVDGDIAVIGAYQDDDNGADSGAA